MASTVAWPHLDQLFKQHSNVVNNGLTFECLLCLPKLKLVKTSVTSASNLRTHIKRVHSSKLDQFNSCMEKERHKRKNCGEDDEPQNKRKQPSVLDHVEGRATKSKVEESVLRFVVGMGLPFTCVEHPDFKNLLKVCGGAAPPNRKQLMENMNSSFSKMKTSLKDTLKGVTSVCATADCWTVFRRSYLGMTVHWLDPATLQRKSMGMSCKRIYGRHTYDVLADAIESILDEFEIKRKTSVIVTDNGSNFIKAFREFGPVISECENNEDDDEEAAPEMPVELGPILDSNEDYARLPPHHCCASHSLNLLSTTDADNAMNRSPAYKRMARQVFAKCQALFNKQNKSSLSADIVKQLLGRYLLIPGATRWNSFFDAVELLKLKQDKLDDLCIQLDVPSFKRPQELNFLEEYCQVMEPIATALDILQGEKGIFMGFLVPTLIGVRKSLQSFSELQFCKPLQDALLDGFNKRFSPILQNLEHRLSAYLVPRFKLDWVDEHKRTEAREELLCAIKKEVHKRGSKSDVNGEGSTSISCKQKDNSKMDRFFTRYVVKSNSDDSSESGTAEGEIVRYLHDTDDTRQMSPLIKSMFVKYNTGVPSSAHCERLFSCAGIVFSDRRGRMTDVNFEQQLLLKFNKFFSVKD